MISFFGIRHHGPGSARSLLQALEALEPDCLLIEGPPEGDKILEYVTNEPSRDAMQPPIAMLNYVKDTPQQAVFDPFAAYSPEWQALQYGGKAGIAIRFMDLPLANRFALQQEALRAQHEAAQHKKERHEAERQEEIAQELATEATPEHPIPADATPITNIPVEDIPIEDIHADFSPAISPTASPAEPTVPPLAPLMRDPLAHLAHAAGYSDGERWWGHVVEERLDVTGVFDAITEAMTSLREAAGGENYEAENLSEAQREANMRKIIRKAVKDGFERIAVICGAWHVPALQRWDAKGQSSKDNKILKGLPKVSVKSTWIPYTTGRLAKQSGYGAGVHSPGWYEHLWHYGTRDDSTIRWLARVAQLIRDEGMMASSAQVIDAVRLAESLAALRGRAVVGLDELNEAAEAVFANGNPLVLQLIQNKLIIADVLGAVSDAVPHTPLQQDLQAQQKRLRFKAQAVEKRVELDLRKETDLARSKLLYRLLLLDIPWGNPHHVSGTGTFKEGWVVAWEPEYTVRVIEAGRYGQTVAQASSAKVKQLSQEAKDIAALSALLERTLLADLPEASSVLLHHLANKAAKANNLSHLLTALPQLVHVLRYGNVRMHRQAEANESTDGDTSPERKGNSQKSKESSDMATIRTVAEGLFNRICIGLPNACHSIADDAAKELFEQVQQIHQAVKLWDEEAILERWFDTLETLGQRSKSHPLLVGRSLKIRLDEGLLDKQEATRALGLALSDSNVEQSATWLEGFLHEGGLLLVHDDAMFNVLDSWVAALSEKGFTRVLPLIRRTFSSFTSPEKEAIGRKAKREKKKEITQVVEVDETRVKAMFDHLSTLLGKSA